MAWNSAVAVPVAAAAAAMNPEWGEHAEAGKQEGRPGEEFDAGLQLPRYLLWGLGVRGDRVRGKVPGVNGVEGSEKQQQSSKDAEPTGRSHGIPSFRPGEGLRQTQDRGVELRCFEGCRARAVAMT